MKITHKLNVWIFQTGEPLCIDGDDARPMRAMNLSNALVRAGHHVVLWSSDFFHQEKRHRYGQYTTIKAMDGLEIKLIPSMGYNKNVGVGRLFDHIQLAFRLKKILKRATEMPDVVFIGYPPIEAAYILVAWCKKHRIPALVDVKDMWPLLFVNVFPGAMRPLGRVFFAPYFHMAKKVMRDATGLSTMASSFLGWALKFSGKTKTASDAVFPLTSPPYQISENNSRTAMTWWNEHDVREDNRFKLCFVGSLSPAFDFKPIQCSAKKALENGLHCQFIICGEGGSSGEIKSMMSDLPNVIFPGWIDQPKITALSEMCHASLAPYKNIGNFMMNVPNKIVDSLLLGLPVLSPLEGEVADLIAKYHVGLRYGTDTGKTLYDCIRILMDDQQLQEDMSKNGKVLYEKNFSFDAVYSALVTHLDQMANA